MNHQKLTMSQVTELATYGVTLYFATNPGKWDELKEIVADRWRQLVHRVSVWQAVQAIRELPETDG